MEAYCMKCKEKREMQNPTPTFTAAGNPMTRGTCPVCGTAMIKMGNTPEHEGLEKPVIEKAAVKKTAGKSTTSAKKSAKTTKSGSTKKSYNSHIGKNQSLVIVESPAKAKTVGRFLGSDYVVRASVGHVRDLNIGFVLEKCLYPSGMSTR